LTRFSKAAMRSNNCRLASSVPAASCAAHMVAASRPQQAATRALRKTDRGRLIRCNIAPLL
jgi:hypothetical protein